MPVSISGFTFIRNGVDLGFPFEASIRSLLPLVDEFVVAVGQGSDDTLARVRAIADPKYCLRAPLMQFAARAAGDLLG